MPFGFGGGRGRGGKGRGFRGLRGPGGFGFGRFTPACVCPKCGLVIPRNPGAPCFQTRCSRCNSIMTRRFFYEE